MTFPEAQQDMRRAYVGGGPGVLVSAIVWLFAALTRHGGGVTLGFAVLFFGGMTIYPLSTLISRVLLHRAKEAQGNLLGMTAIESTVALIGGLFAAWLLMPFKAAYVFPVAAIAVGARYAVFETIYGDRLYWMLSGLIMLIGLTPIFLAPVPGGVALTIGIVEAVFGALLTSRGLKRI